MTDREELLKLLERFRLTPSSEDQYPTGATAVTLVAKEGGVEGYPGFAAVFDFDGDENFKALGLYE